MSYLEVRGSVVLLHTYFHMTVELYIVLTSLLMKSANEDNTVSVK